MVETVLCTVLPAAAYLKGPETASAAYGACGAASRASHTTPEMMQSSPETTDCYARGVCNGARIVCNGAQIVCNGARNTCNHSRVESPDLFGYLAPSSG